MGVRRIVPNLPARDPAALARFYERLLGLAPAMDHGFIVTLAGEAAPLQLSLASDGGSGQPVPALSVEVDDLAGVLARARDLGAAIPYGPTREPWGVERFFLRDPEGNLVNILSHVDTES